MKKIMMTLMAALLMSSAAVAQDNQQRGKHPDKKPDKTEMAKHRTDKMVKRYKLNDKQAKQLLDLNLKYADKMGGPRHGHHGGPGHGRPPKDGAQQPPQDGHRQKMEATRKAYVDELQKIMTREQFKQYEEDMQKDHGHHGGHHGGHHKGQRPPRDK